MIRRITYREFVAPDGKPLDGAERLALGQREGDVGPPIGLQHLRGAALVPQPLGAHVAGGLAAPHVEVGSWKKNQKLSIVCKVAEIVQRRKNTRIS